MSIEKRFKDIQIAQENASLEELQNAEFEKAWIEDRTSELQKLVSTDLAFLEQEGFSLRPLRNGLCVEGGHACIVLTLGIKSHYELGRFFAAYFDEFEDRDDADTFIWMRDIEETRQFIAAVRQADALGRSAHVDPDPVFGDRYREPIGVCQVRTFWKFDDGCYHVDFDDGEVEISDRVVEAPFAKRYVDEIQAEIASSIMWLKKNRHPAESAAGLATRDELFRKRRGRHGGRNS